MKKRIKNKWLKELRSGAYKQGRGVMLKITDEGDEFCCLGVLCDIHARETGNAWCVNQTTVSVNSSPDSMFSGPRYLEHEMELPQGVVDWAGLDSLDPVVKEVADATGYVHKVMLSDCNDGSEFSGKKMSFNQIANLIDKVL